MAAQDYYETLEVSRDAAPDEIKRAFRRLARQHHPDVNQDDPQAEDRFKQIGEAYAVLSDPDKRAEYDRYGQVLSDGGWRPDTFAEFQDVLGGMGSLFDFIFGAGTGRSRAGGAPGGPQRGSDLRYRLEISLEEAAEGVNRPITLSRRQACPHCLGNQSEPGHQPETCSGCGGRGQVQQVRQTVFGLSQMIMACPECQGEGRVITHPCSRCHGSGEIEVERSLSVDIPPGVDTGNHLRLAGEGDAGRGGGPSGDLFVVVSVSPHERFEREGVHLVAPLPLGLAQAALGAQLEFETLWQTATVTVAPGTSHGTVLTLNGEGMPDVRTGRKGDLYLRVELEVPSQLTDEQKHALLQYAELRDEAVHPPDGWIDRLRQHFGRKK